MSGLPPAAASSQFSGLSTKCLTDRFFIPAAVKACSVPGRFWISHHQPLLSWQRSDAAEVHRGHQLEQQALPATFYCSYSFSLAIVQYSHECPAGQTESFADNSCVVQSRLVCQAYARTGDSAGARKAMPLWRLANHL